MKRVLHIVGTMDMGGQETFIMNIYREIDRKKVQFDFVVHSNNRGYYEDEIKKLGGKIYRIEPMGKNIIKHCKDLYKILKKNPKYIVHRHTCSSIVWIDLLVAKMAKIEERIVHCHATHTTSHGMLNTIFKVMINSLATVKLACSKKAGIFLYGKKQNFEVVYNAIDTKKFLFNNNIRNKIREEYKINYDELILGHIGRFDKSKNHKFLIEVFEKVVNVKKDAQLWLIGDGELKEELEKMIVEKGLKDNVKFLGIKSNCNEYLMAMDIFVFPSIYEGLGIALIEAQCTGISCIVSENIVEEAIVTKNVIRLNLSDESAWAEKILSIKTHNRVIDINKTEINNYKIEKLINQIERIYRL